MSFTWGIWDCNEVKTKLIKFSDKLYIPWSSSSSCSSFTAVFLTLDFFPLCFSFKSSLLLSSSSIFGSFFSEFVCESFLKTNKLILIHLSFCLKCIFPILSCDRFSSSLKKKEKKCFFQSEILNFPLPFPGSNKNFSQSKGNKLYCYLAITW